MTARHVHIHLPAGFVLTGPAPLIKAKVADKKAPAHDCGCGGVPAADGDPNQPRDSDGKWGHGSKQPHAKASHREHAVYHTAQRDLHEREMERKGWDHPDDEHHDRAASAHAEAINYRVKADEAERSGNTQKAGEHGISGELANSRAEGHEKNIKEPVPAPDKPKKSPKGYHPDMRLALGKGHEGKSDTEVMHEYRQNYGN